MNIVDEIASKQLKKDIPEFKVGDTLRVDVQIKEGKRERIQSFEGLVISRKGSKIGETFTVRKVSYGIGVERTFKVHAPNIEIHVISKGRVRRAKLNFIRDMKKQYRIKEGN